MLLVTVNESNEVFHCYLLDGLTEVNVIVLLLTFMGPTEFIVAYNEEARFPVCCNSYSIECYPLTFSNLVLELTWTVIVMSVIVAVRLCKLDDAIVE